MKDEIINIIRILGIGSNEILLDIDLTIVVTNSIEFREPDEIILHHFDKDDYDYELNYDDIDEVYQKLLWRSLSVLIYN